ESDADRCVGEVWAPVWDRPMTVPEVSGVLARGRAEIAGRAANTPGAFAGAIVKRGIDAGLVEFRRFQLVHTTSTNTFESTLAATVPVRKGSTPGTAAAAERAVLIRDALPADRKKGKRWDFHGLC